MKNTKNNIVNFKRPACWIILVAIAACIALGVCFVISRTFVNDPNDLIQIYYHHYASGNVKKIKRIYKGLDDDHINKIKKIPDYIEEFEIVETYTKPGPDEGTYVVFVYNKVKLKEYEKLIPSIDTFYICPDRFGNLYINGEVTDEVDKYIKEMTYQSDINDLNNKVAKEYNELYESDKDFGSLINNIRRAFSD